MDKEKQYWVVGNNRTVEGLMAWAEKWEKQGGGIRSNLMQFRSSEFKPLIKTGSTGNTLILSVMPIPWLHTGRLGPVNHILDNLITYYPELEDRLFKTLHLKKGGYHGGEFEGNECMKILNNLEKLQIPSNLKQFETVLNCLKNLDSVISQPILQPMYIYSEAIKSFTAAWQDLILYFPITTINKIHIIMAHLEDCIRVNQRTLTRTTDQTIEAMHQFVHRIFTRYTVYTVLVIVISLILKYSRSNYYVKNRSNPTHGQKLLQGVLHVNGYSLHLMD